jgi:hypothetical protein
LPELTDGAFLMRDDDPVPPQPAPEARSPALSEARDAVRQWGEAHALEAQLSAVYFDPALRAEFGVEAILARPRATHRAAAGRENRADRGKQVT